VTCATFAQYTTKFTHSSNKALEEVEKNGQLDGMSKRWEILGKFEANFNHWFQVRASPVFSILPIMLNIIINYRFTWIASNSMRAARTCRYCHWW
jgi:hypothetical protein